MLYFYIGMAAAAACIINGISYAWFTSSQENTFHSIINLWFKDPIEKAILVEQSLPCPQGTQIEQIRYHYSGTKGLCSCEQINYDENDSDYRRLQEKEYQNCSTIYCPPNFKSQEKISPIPAQNVKNFFVSSDEKTNYKLCTSRIEGYSFAKKSPNEKECSSDEKYCSFSANESPNFDIDHGYCIPKHRECFLTGIQLSDVTKGVLELPLVGFFVSEEMSEIYNIIDYKQFTQKQVLDYNKISYQPEYNYPLSQDKFFLHTQFVPRVKARCRKQLKDTLSTYINPDQVRRIYLALVIISCFSCIFQFFISGYGDIEDMKFCEKKDTFDDYCNAKRMNKKNHICQKLYYVSKPLLVLIQIILYIVVIVRYISMIDYMKFMIEDGCLDSYVRTVLNYDDPGDEFYNVGFTYTCLSVCLLGIAADQNIYVLTKKILEIVCCKFKYCLKESQQRHPIQLQISPDMNGQNQADNILINEEHKIIDLENNIKMKEENNPNLQQEETHGQDINNQQGDIQQHNLSRSNNATTTAQLKNQSDSIFNDQKLDDIFEKSKTYQQQTSEKEQSETEHHTQKEQCQFSQQNQFTKCQESKDIIFKDQNISKDMQQELLEIRILEKKTIEINLPPEAPEPPPPELSTKSDFK